MLIHLVYEEEYVEQLKNILESAGHRVTEWDYSLTQFADFSERKQITAEIALVDGQAGVITKRDIIESLGRVRRNLPYLRLIVVFPESLKKDEAFISKLLTFSLYDMYFKEEYDIDDLELWINTPKSYANYNIEIEDIQGSLKKGNKSKIQGIENPLKQSALTSLRQTKTLSLPRITRFSLHNIDVKLQNLPSVKSIMPLIHLPWKDQDQVESELCWDEGVDQESHSTTTEIMKELLGKVVWFRGSSPDMDVSHAVTLFAQNLSESLPVLLLDGNLINPRLLQKYHCPSPGWECSWLEKTPGRPPKKYFSKGNLSVWTLLHSVDVDEVEEMWEVALFHIRTPQKIVVVDGGTFSPPEGVDLNVLMVNRESAIGPDQRMVSVGYNEVDGAFNCVMDYLQSHRIF